MADPKPNVLVVDDNEALLEFVLIAVAKLGYVPVGRTSPESALDVVRDTPSLRLLLSDVCLESTTGPDFVRLALRERPELKVVFMTGGFNNVSFRRTDPVVIKPFRLERLQEAIDTVFNAGEAKSDRQPVVIERRRCG